MPRPSLRAQHQEELLRLLAEGTYDARAVASQLAIHPRSLARLIRDLKSQGHRIVAVRDGKTWTYRLESPL